MLVNTHVPAAAPALAIPGSFQDMNVMIKVTDLVVDVDGFLSQLPQLNNADMRTADGRHCTGMYGASE